MNSAEGQSGGAVAASAGTQVRRQSAVAELGLQALANPDLERLFERTVELVSDTLETELCKILELLPEGRCLLRAGVGWEKGLVGKAVVGAGRDSQAGFTLKSKEPVVVEDWSNESRFRGPDLLTGHGVRSGVSVVIEGRSRPFGVLGVHSRRRRIFSDEDISFLQSVANVLGSAVDRQLSESALRQSEETTRAIVDTCIDGIITIDESGAIRSFNPAAERIFGYSAAEAVGRNVSMLMPHPDRNRHNDYIRHYLETGEARIIGFGREVRGCRKSGENFPMHLGVGEMQMGDHRMFVGLVRDLTYFKQVQDELMQAQSLAALGEMAASVAHEIKNPLAAILGVIQVLRDSEAISREYRDVVEELSRRVERLDETVKRLLNFAKPVEPDSRVVDLVDVIRQVVDSVRREDRLRLVDFRFGCPGKVRAPVDLVLFEDLLRNLIYNAADAMSEGGEITIGCRRRENDVVVSVADTGTGIQEDVLNKVFRPFYTTKRGGTGLGLALCKKIAEAHGGSIRIVRRSGGGSEVLVSLPPAAGDSIRKSRRGA